MALVKSKQIEKHLVTLKCQGLSSHSKESRLGVLPQALGVLGTEPLLCAYGFCGSSVINDNAYVLCMVI